MKISLPFFDICQLSLPVLIFFATCFALFTQNGNVLNGSKFQLGSFSMHFVRQLERNSNLCCNLEPDVVLSLE